MNLEFIDRLFDGESRELAIRVRQGVVNALKHVAHDPSSPAYRRQLVLEYWRLLRHLILRSVPAGSGPLTFTDDERLALDLGYLSSDLLANGLTPERLGAIALDREPDPERPLRTLSLSSFLIHKFAQFTGCHGLDRSNARIGEIREEIAREWLRTLLAGREREALLASVLTEPGAVEKFRVIEERFHETAVALADAKLGANRTHALSKENRQEIIGLEGTLNRLKGERLNLYRWQHVASGNIFRSLLEFDAKTEERILRARELAAEETRIRGEIAAHLRAAQPLPFEKKEAFLDEWLKRLQNAGANAAWHERLDPQLPQPALVDPDLADLVIACVRTAELADRDLFNNCRTRYNSRPVVVFLPACGGGVYSGEFDALFIPINPTGNPVTSTFAALAQYRWAMDDTGRIVQHYRSLQCTAALSAAQAEARFVKAWAAFVTGAADPEVICEEEVRWFRDWLCRSAEELRGEGMGPADRFAERAAELHGRIRLVCPRPELADHLEIRRSTRHPGTVELHFRDVDPAEDLVALLEAVLSHARLNRFRELVDKE